MRTPRRTHRRSAAAVLTTAVLSTAVLVAGLLVAGTTATSAGAGVATGGLAARAGSGGDRIVHSGRAFGSQVTGLGVAGSGRTALSVLCTTDPTASSGNDVAATAEALSAAVDLGAVTTSVAATKVDGKRATVTRSSVATVDLLGGQLQLEGISSRARVVRTATGFRVEGSSNLVGVTLGGVPLPTDQLSANLPGQIDLPGLGTLYFNEQQRSTTRSSGTSVVTAVRVVLPALDAEVKLGLATARLADHKPGAFAGGAWSTTVAASGLAESGRTGYQPLPCHGTDGDVLRRNDTAHVGIEDAVDVGATVSTARTFRRANGDVVAVTRNEVAGVDLGGDALGIEAVVARVETVRKPGGRIVSTPTFKVLGLVLGGEAQDAPVPGQKLEVPGLGYVEFGRVVEGGRGDRITAVTVVLLEGEDETRVTIGNAVARILR